MRKLTTAEFVRRATLIHGNKYGYDEVIYVRSHSKIIIKCPKHGAFLQTPSSHLLGHGCAGCQYDKARLSTEEFVNKAKKIHGNRYGYDEAVYRHSNCAIKITCRTHGHFHQKPSNHLKGKGCPQCGKGITHQDFIRICRTIHAEAYDYKITIYVGLKHPISVLCPSHGEFVLSAFSHLQGTGCPECHKKQIQEEFINRACKCHKGKYSYDKVVYKHSKTKVIIECPEHGEFAQHPTGHLQGRGCPQCVYDRARIDFTEFIRRARQKHGSRYDYTASSYQGWLLSISITCKKHGVFQQTPRDHVRGSGCPRCAHNRVSKTSQAWLDSLGVPPSMREKNITVKGRRFCVDAFDHISGTVYEYFGYFWHGHPDHFDSKATHPISKKNFGELYAATLEKIACLEQSKYDFVFTWGP